LSQSFIHQGILSDEMFLLLIGTHN